MTCFTGPGTGRLLLIHLTKGEDILKSVTQAVKDAGIVSGVVVSGIGSLRKWHYHYIGDTDDRPSDVFQTIEGPLELACMQGAILEGVPHLHAVVSEHGTKTWSGHVEEGCEVQYLAEICILEMADMPLGRRKKGEFGIANIEMIP
ncbi:MAG: DNA-binding protein [Oscillospiraceae bacterium]|nr:DNA-binding protein [Oscillospiraceae bacterium]